MLPQRAIPAMTQETTSRLRETMCRESSPPDRGDGLDPPWPVSNEAETPRRSAARSPFGSMAQQPGRERQAAGRDRLEGRAWPQPTSQVR
jgi:hypothetical protein